MATTQPLYAAREPIFPKRVRGRFRTLKWALMAAMLGIYYLTPWIRYDRGPNLPNQAVLVDLAKARFYFFGIEIWPHEFWLVAGMLIMAGLGLFLFTAILGRVWCGYACPQTIWTDLFMAVERWVEGDRNARLRLHRAPMTAKKAGLRLTKYTIWAAIGMATGGAWVFYFADAPTLAMQFLALEAPPVAWITVAILTFMTVWFGGFMREQVCIYMCPWPRIQGAMMDPKTLTIAYRDWRGEPRGKLGKAEGDCIDCNACVAVCPTGIDIRDGQQMECITCGLCIDACDEMMDKVGRPRGLVGYLALADAPKEAAGAAPAPFWSHLVRPRPIIYFTLWAAIGLGLLFGLFLRQEVGMTVAAVRNPQYVLLADGSVRNAYDVRLRNRHGEWRTFHLSLSSPELLRIALEGTDTLSVDVPADSTLMQRVYVVARPEDPAATAERTPLRLFVEDLQTGDRAAKATHFIGAHP